LHIRKTKMKASHLFCFSLGLLVMLALPQARAARSVYALSAADAPETNAWTKKPVERKKEGIPIVTLREVRAADQSKFDRVVFEFKEAQAVPGYRVAYVSEPIHDEADRVVKLYGKAVLRVDLNPALAHSIDTGAPSLGEREKRLNLKTVIEFKQVEDFEGVVTYGLGLSRKKPFRVTEMLNPTRLVIDIKH
jgi:hypothetical protein